MQLTAEDVQEILKVFLDSEMQEIHIEVGDVKVRASKRTAAGARLEPAVEPTQPTGVAEAAEPTESAGSAEPIPRVADVETESARRDGLVAVTAPLLGTFYRCPAPGQPPFVEVGAEVDAQDPVCLIEVMKLFNQIHAECKGRIAEIVVDDGAMVEFGQTLMWVEPVAGD